MPWLPSLTFCHFPSCCTLQLQVHWICTYLTCEGSYFVGIWAPSNVLCLSSPSCVTGNTATSFHTMTMKLLSQPGRQAHRSFFKQNDSDMWSELGRMHLSKGNCYVRRTAGAAGAAAGCWCRCANAAGAASPLHQLSISETRNSIKRTALVNHFNYFDAFVVSAQGQSGGLWLIWNDDVDLL